MATLVGISFSGTITEGGCKSCVSVFGVENEIVKCTSDVVRMDGRKTKEVLQHKRLERKHRR